MSITGIGATNYTAQGTPPAANKAGGGQNVPAGDLLGVGDMKGGSPASAADIIAQKKEDEQTVADFIKYMSMSQEEKLQEAWLRQHGISKDDLDAMAPEKREAVLKQMAQEIKDQVLNDTREKAAGTKPSIDIMA